MKKTLANYRINIPLLKTGVVVFIDKRDELQAYYRGLMEELNLETHTIRDGLTICDVSDNYNPVILVDSSLNKLEFITTLVHEILHAVNFICQQKRIGTSQENDELIAYMQGYILEEILRELKY